MPNEASAVQQREMKKSFYAGAFTMLGLMTDLGDTIESEEQGIIALEILNLELETFFESITTPTR